MNFVVVLLVAVIGFVCSNCEEKYTSKFDNIDLDAILNNERLLKNYADCLLDRGRCSPDGMELKRFLPDALQTACAKCTEAQNQKSKKAISNLINNKPQLWEELQAKYDPEGFYLKKYQSQLTN